MKTKLAVLVGIVACAPAWARPPAPASLAGTWSVEVAKLPAPPAARPRSVTFTFAAAGSGKWSVQVDIIDAAGTERRSQVTAAVDGSLSPVAGDATEADVAALMLPRPGVMVITLSKGGVPGSTRIYAVAPNGQTMVETATYFGRDGLPVMRTNYFIRTH